MIDLFDPSKNKIFIGSTDKLPEWSGENAKPIDKIKLLLKNYLELDNVSFLFGSGTSIHLGAVSIRSFPIEVEKYIQTADSTVEHKGVHQEFLTSIEELQARWHAIEKAKLDEGETSFVDENNWAYRIDGHLVRDEKSNEIAIEFEKVLNYLLAKDYVFDANSSLKRTDSIKNLILVIKKGLFSVCDVENRNIPAWLVEKKNASASEIHKRQALLLERENKYLFHEKFLKSLLQRPLNLRRANIFTLNYDLAFEYAFDRLGVHYIDGFSGFHKRFFKPETFEYDIFYPGSTTSGKVQRIEKVVRYFKLHGSLSWVNSNKIDSNNLYGIEEMSLPMINSLEKKGEIIVYPAAVKKSYTLDLPYSELFRQFSATITQSQSVLVTVGYAFADEHFNDIIFQALSNPTFTLIIVDFYGTENNQHIERIKNLNDSRIIILQGDFFGDFLTLADTLMPDSNSFDSSDKVADTLNEYFNTNKKDH
ncbi:SIR2 family protein [Dyadobacter sp. CY327]|uniref:SIR2 family protein n=1 Tax=Dyadobacter sp. CY327 TaxID=2907301 RepID=UPI001F1D856B|nr:SIR2 family protein [Dyadobacter sp. CY327]MCE7070942.1 SIR2 family protein [Dyadobacter sp. CY327]